VPLELADDRWGGVGGELDVAVRVEPVDGLDQPDPRHLDQVVEGLPPAGEPASEILDQAEVRLDELVASVRILAFTEIPEEPLDLFLGELRVALLRQLSHPFAKEKVAQAMSSGDVTSTPSVTDSRMARDQVVRNGMSGLAGASPHAWMRSESSWTVNVTSRRRALGADVARILEQISSIAMWRSVIRS
jgi:hypothetical protein